MHVCDIECPACHKTVWVINGVGEDLTVSDVEAIKCPWCTHEFLIPDRGDAYLVDCDVEPGYKTAALASEWANE